VQRQQLCDSCTLLSLSSFSRRYELTISPFDSALLTSLDTPNRGTQKAINIGDNDASPDNTPSQFLLLRGLEPSVTEELLAKGVGKLHKPSASNHFTNQTGNKKGAKVASTTGDANLGAKEGTLLRVLLVRDRRTNESWRFGFAEFATVEDAMAALTRYNSFDKFTIASKPVVVSYVHSGVFVPALNPGAVDPRFTFAPLINPSMKIAYWDEEAFVSEFKVSESEKESTDQTSKKEDLTRGAIESKEVGKSKKRKAEPTAMDISTAKKAAPSYLQRWTNQHAELHGLEPKPIDVPSAEAPIKADTKISSESSSAPLTQSYADPNRKCCYLCSRQFKTGAEVNKHERLSNLHQSNLKNEELLTRARAKLEKHGITIQPQLHTAEYRDRAKERRKAFGVVNKKGQQIQPSKSSSGTTKPSVFGEDDGEDTNPVPTTSKGASLLGKMGYIAGAGLGATGTGLTTPIAQDVYVAGVGLGAQGGKVGNAVEEAERNTRGNYGDFLAKTREGARERYDRLNG
jgi:G-patch domain/RNA recognition motif. (a.k.a. RRM, RBD, or RNP domain)